MQEVLVEGENLLHIAEERVHVALRKQRALAKRVNDPVLERRRREYQRKRARATPLREP